MTREPHELKTVNPYFDLIWRCEKTAELRKNDQGFAVGDILVLREFCPPTRQCWMRFTGRAIVARISDVCDYPDALRPDYVMLSLDHLANTYEYNRDATIAMLAMLAKLEGGKL